MFYVCAYTPAEKLNVKYIQKVSGEEHLGYYCAIESSKPSSDLY